METQHIETQQERKCLSCSHLERVCMSYCQHMCFSLYLSKEMFVSSIKAVIHAFIPSCFVTSSTDTITRLHEEMSEIGCHNVAINDTINNTNDNTIVTPQHSNNNIFHETQRIL